MTCRTGCCLNQREHYASLSLSTGVNKGQNRTKTTTDVHDTHTVDVVETYNDTQSVVVKPDALRIAPYKLQPSIKAE